MEMPEDEEWMEPGGRKIKRTVENKYKRCHGTTRKDQQDKSTSNQFLPENRWTHLVE